VCPGVRTQIKASLVDALIAAAHCLFGTGRRTSLIDGRDIHDAVEDELRPALGSDLDLEPEPHTQYGPDAT